MTGVRRRGLPAMPLISAFPELNVRTYVRGPDGRAGVWFFSLDAPGRIAVRVAREVFGLAYMNATMLCRPRDGWIAYESLRTGPWTTLAFGRTRTPDARLSASYRPTGEMFYPAPGRLEEFLTNRYCLYAWRRGRLVRGEIDHAPWPLQPAEARIERNTMAAALGIDDLPIANGFPLLHYADQLDVRAWLPHPVG
jgi:uncharacterized protein YqjF (DUF2071 family)